MAHVSIRNPSKIVAHPADPAQIRAFYQGVLGCELTKKSAEVDYIRFQGGFFMAVRHVERRAATPRARRLMKREPVSASS